MAFTTRTGRTAAIGTGSMSTSIVLMLVSFLGLAAPVAVAVGFAVWLLWPEARVSMKELLPAALYFAVSVLGLQVIIRAGAACCYLVAFVGPRAMSATTSEPWHSPTPDATRLSPPESAS